MIATVTKQMQGTEIDFEVFEDNWPSFMFFMQLTTQWVKDYPGMGGRIMSGLNYASVEAMMRIQRIKNRQELFADIQIMEFAALPILNKQTKE